jgi:hypothetical protein
MAVIASRSEDPAAIARTTADSTTFQPTRRDVEGATVIAGTGLPLVDAFLAEQWSLIGTCEQPCGSDNAPPITTWYGIGDVPWCAETQSYALHMVGYEAFRFHAQSPTSTPHRPPRPSHPAGSRRTRSSNAMRFAPNAARASHTRPRPCV